MQPPRRLLILHDQPDEVLPALSGLGLEVAVAAAPPAVSPAVRRHQPDVVFSITQSGPMRAPAGHSARR